jgi:NADPH:quinone reductase-like Zn-dependent oxidoreductase
LRGRPTSSSALRWACRPIPVPQAGEVLIRVKAFGLNRSELFIARAKSDGPNVTPLRA